MREKNQNQTRKTFQLFNGLNQLSSLGSSVDLDSSVGLVQVCTKPSSVFFLELELRHGPVLGGLKYGEGFRENLANSLRSFEIDHK